MAYLGYTSGPTGYDNRSLNFEALINGSTLYLANAGFVGWRNGAVLIGEGLVTYVTAGQQLGGLGDLSGGTLTRISGQVGGTGIFLTGLSLSAAAFFDLVLAKDWAGLASFVLQGDDLVVGDQFNDTLIGGAGDDQFYSHAGRDILYGGTGNDTLEAMGGHDLMTGGRGADTFLFKTEPVPGQDWWVTIKDFSTGTDRIEVLDVFDNIGLDGPLGAEHFHIGRAATTADHGIVYNRAKGWLFYDADGSGALDKVLLAKFGAGTVLTVEDIWVV